MVAHSPARMVRRRPPWWLVAAKVVLAGLLATGTFFPQVGGFAGKGTAFRLPLFLLPALVIPAVRLIKRGPPSPYPVALDAGLTLPFLLDTAGNAFGLYDSVDVTDDVLHFVNWALLFGGVTTALRRAALPKWIVWAAGSGFGAMGSIFWELSEYGVMQTGVAGLHLTYADTLGDLVLSTLGGCFGALVAVRLGPEPPQPAGPPGVQALVREFHSAFGLPQPGRPTTPTAELAEVRSRLLAEEAGEAVQALRRGDLAQIAQELAGVAYVTYGAAVSTGIDLDQIVTAVHRANMTKLDADGRPVMIDGKVTNGPRYQPPDIAGLLAGDVNSGD
jgi:predicted HAD superfamily Cof-like phosphohydrolase